MPRLSSLILALVCTTALAGCAANQREEQIKAAKVQMAAEKASCDKLWPPRQGNNVAHIRCINVAIDRSLKPFAPYPDLVSLIEAYKLSFAAKVDRGELTPEDADLQMAQVAAQVASEERNRMNAAQVAQAQSAAAAGNLMAGMAAIQQANRPPMLTMPPNPMITTNCNRMGNFTNCTSY